MKTSPQTCAPGRGEPLYCLLPCLLSCLLCCVACQTTPASEPTPVTVRARTPAGLPVAGARIWAAGRDLGTTTATGELEAQLGATTTLTTVCPATHRSVTPERRVALPPGRGNADRLVLTVECAPLQQHAALVVRAHGAGGELPVRVHGEVVGHTDVDGVAHLLLDARPGSAVRVSIDTSARPTLRPQEPVQTFRLGDRDEILLFDQALVDVRPKRRVPRRAPAAPSPQLPYRIR